MAVSSPDTERMVAYQATENGVVRRFRNPFKYDVLSGRGGSVNSHFGNVYFRELVQARKFEYTLESNKERKAQICREVMAQVTEKGGTFLMKETADSGRNTSTTEGFWTEQSDERTMAKVSQALREGAPRMREAVLGTSAVPNARKRSMRQPHHHHHHKSADDAASPSKTTSKQVKRVRVEYRGKQVHPSEVTPPLTISTTPDTVVMPPLTLSQGSSLPATAAVNNANANYELLPPQQVLFPNPKTLDQLSSSSISLTGIYVEDDNFLGEDFVDPFALPMTMTELPAMPDRKLAQRSHSLVLSDISANPNYLQDDFVNPFDFELDDHHIGGRHNNNHFSLSRQTSNGAMRLGKSTPQ